MDWLAGGDVLGIPKSIEATRDPAKVAFSSKYE